MSYPKSNRDPGQTLQYAFNENSGRLKVELPAQGEAGDSVLEIDIRHTDDSVRLGDGSKLTTATTVSGKVGLDTNIINKVRIDDSIPIAVTTESGGDLQSRYDEIASVPSNTETVVLSYMVPFGKEAVVKKIEVSGTNIATYTIKVNSSVVQKKRTYFTGNLNESFDFLAGLRMTAGDLVQVLVVHTRPDLGDFNANTLIVEI